MAEVDAGPPARELGGFGLNLLPAFAVTTVFASALVLVAGRTSAAAFGLSGGLRTPELVPALALVVGAGLAAVAGLRRYGWLVAGLGLLTTAALYLQGQALPEASLYLLLALALGLQLGGLLLAFAAAPPDGRWGIVLGAGFGLGLGGRYALVALTDWLGGAGHASELTIGLLAAITVTCGLFTALPLRPTPAVGGVAGALAVIVVASVAARGLALGWEAAFDAIARSSTGGISQERARSLEAMNTAARVGIAVVVTVALLVAAYRRGGAGLARWVVVAFAAAAASLAPVTDPPGRWILLLSGAVGALLAFGATRIARSAPWDAVGVVVASVGVLPTSPWGRLELPGLTGAGIAAVAAGLTFALTAGLARLVGPGRGLSGDTAALSAGYGFAVLILGQQVLAGTGATARLHPGDPRLDGVLTLAVAAVVLVALFLLGRRVPAGGTAPGETPGGLPGVPTPTPPPSPGTAPRPRTDAAPSAAAQPAAVPAPGALASAAGPEGSAEG